MIYILAILVGLILNFTPCAFACISAKVSTIANHKRGHGIIYSIGCVIAFTTLGLISLGAIWGVWAAYPLFNALMATIFTILGLSALNLIYISHSLDTALGRAKAYLGSRVESKALLAAFMGVLSPIVGASCLAPFMGSVLMAGLYGSGTDFLVFPLMGLGMALPFLMLDIWPGCARIIPKSGRWNLWVKRLTAIPLFGAALWFALLI